MIIHVNCDFTDLLLITETSDVPTGLLFLPLLMV